MLKKMFGSQRKVGKVTLTQIKTFEECDKIFRKKMGKVED
jgi:hypothetical protein